MYVFEFDKVHVLSLVLLVSHAGFFQPGAGVFLALEQESECDETHVLCLSYRPHRGSYSVIRNLALC